MNTIRLNLVPKKILVLFLVIMSFLLFTKCNKKVNFQTSSVVPAARGFVKVNRDNNKNYVIRIELSDLAEVKRLQPSRNTYVVWMETDDQRAKNLGQMKSSSGMLSRKLKASFETVSVQKPSKVFITAEDDASTQYPGSMVVLSTSGF
jgi:hypothetical protein